MKEFMEWTAWEMTRPESYGVFHLTFFFVGLAVSAVLAWLLRGLGEKGNKVLLLTVGGVLLASEIYRQLFYYHVIGNGSVQWWTLPFQLCDMPIYLCIIAPLLKKGKVQDALYNFMLAFNLMGGFIAFLEPSGLTHEYWVLTLHAFIWHMTLVFIGLYLGFSRRAGTKLSGYKGTVVVYVILCAVAFGINCALWKVSEGTINMFYVGPRNSPLIVFETICEKLGWYVNTPIYMACCCLGAFLFYLPFCKLNGRKKTETVCEASSEEIRP